MLRFCGQVTSILTSTGRISEQDTACVSVAQSRSLLVISSTVVGYVPAESVLLGKVFLGKCKLHCQSRPDGGLLSRAGAISTEDLSSSPASNPRLGTPGDILETMSSEL